MKKINFALLTLLALTFTGCFNPVFSNIKKEVALKPATVSGNVNSIVRCGNYLVTQTGSAVYYASVDNTAKTVSGWTKRGNSVFSPVSFDYYGSSEYRGQYIFKIASNDINIYILTAEFLVDNDGKVKPKAYHLYYSTNVTGSDWTEIPDVPFVMEDTTLLYDNGPNAYIRCGADYYKLSNPLGTKYTPVPADKYLTATAYIKDTADQTKYSYIYADGNKIMGDNGTVIYTAAGTVSALALTKDYLIFGCGNPSSPESTGGGIYHLAIDQTTKDIASSLSGFNSNADAALTSSYQITALVAAFPDKPESENYIYAGANFKTAGGSISVSYENICLWSYVPTRGNWNRE